MKIETLITILQNRITNLERYLNTYKENGDLENFIIVETEIEETKETLKKLGA